MKKFEWKLGIYEQLSAITLYELGVPTSSIAYVLNSNYSTILESIKRFEKFKLTRVRSRSETVLMTLSKYHSIPRWNSKGLVKKWVNEFGLEGIKDILTVILLTDGHASYKDKIVSLTNSDKILLGIFTDILKELKLDPREMIDKRNGLFTIFARSNKVKNILRDIKEIRTPTTKHQPARGKQNWKEFLISEDQPTINFLLNTQMSLKQLIFRLMMSFEGCVSVDVTTKRLTRPELQFTCFHPLLIKEWKKFAESINIPMNKKKNVLTTVSLVSTINFLKIGDFIDKVVNSNKSKYFKGIEKNTVLLGILEYCYREREGLVPKVNSSQKINKYVKSIIKKKEYKNAAFYISYFSLLVRKYNGTLNETLIFKILSSGPKSIKILVKNSKLSVNTVHTVLKRLLKKGMIKRMSRGIYSLL